MYESYLRQDITYWHPTGTSDAFGAVVFAAPQYLRGRWEDKTDLVRSKTGEEITTRSRVFLPQDISIDGYLFLGQSLATDPRTVPGAYEVQSKGRQPDLRNLKQLTVAWL
jgi:hypothetical protein